MVIRGKRVRASLRDAVGVGDDGQELETLGRFSSCYPRACKLLR